MPERKSQNIRLISMVLFLETGWKMIVINLKNYKIGKEIIDLVRVIEIYCRKAIVAVPALNLKEVATNSRASIIAQHVDFKESGRGTGYTTPEALIGAGINFSLLNHSEHKVLFNDIKKCIKRCNEVGLKLIICASTLTEARKIKSLNPYAIAFEDRKLIATGKSITLHKAHDIKKFVEMLKDSGVIPLCGAGISSGEDVKEALALGCKGVLVASAVANSQNPEKFLKEASELI